MQIVCKHSQQGIPTFRRNIYSMLTSISLLSYYAEVYMPGLQSQFHISTLR